MHDVEHRLVLGRHRDDVVGRAVAAARRRDALEREVVGFGRAAGEHDLAGAAPISAATCARAASTASRASQPNACCLLCGLPNCSVKYGSIASSTRGSTGVVAW